MTGADDDPTAPTDDEVSTIVARCVEAMELGDPDPAAGLCEGRPRLEVAVRAQLDRLVGMQLLEVRSIPETIGPYRIVEEIGHGGMGTVLLAEQETPVRRRVALKLIKRGLDSAEVIARFRAERQALALMNHSCIAKVFDAATTDDGRPYFVMEYVEGVPITTHCDASELGLRERIRLFQRVCSGVQHAHQKGVIHRDLKPSNVLVTRDGDEAVPKIIDFGLARATGVELVGQSLLTAQGIMLGTPEYMSPEQAAMTADGVDTRTDIYSLGVMLYELLTGELPFPSDQLRRAGVVEIQRRLREDQPPKPSTKIGAADSEVRAARRRATTTSLRKSITGDLDWIVMMAMAKEPDRRYDSANELAMDLRRYLEHEPVLAGPPSVGYRLSKLAQKYRTQVIAALFAFVALAVGLVLAITAWNRSAVLAISERDQREAAQTHLRRYDQLANVVLLRNLEAAVTETYPAWPRNVEAIRDWLGRARPLLGALPRLRESLATIEALRSTRAQDEFLRETLTTLVADLDEFASDVVSKVERRESWAEAIDGLTRAHPNARVTWEAAGTAIRTADGVTASELYRSDPPLELVPQLGLVPIGMNPRTRLWEFYHLRSAWDPHGDLGPETVEIPRHGPNGTITVTPATGIVFVLVPGGTFWMGAQNDDPDLPNYDEDAHPSQLVHQVTLAPYLIARHELTQGQWLRLTETDNPSVYQPPWFVASAMPSAVSLAHPVEHMSWDSARRAMTRHGLNLPTEAQWERAARAGTSTKWWTGQDRASLIVAGVAPNLADKAAHRAGARWQVDWPELDDHWAVHAPVDAGPENPWGLHHIHGNVREWCRDRYVSYDQPCRPGDGLRTVTGPFAPGTAESTRITRGSGFSGETYLARSAYRARNDPATTLYALGLRAARAVKPADRR